MKKEDHVQHLVSHFNQNHSDQPHPSSYAHATLVHAPWAGWQYEVPAEEDCEMHGQSEPSHRVIAEFRVSSASEASWRVSQAVAVAELEAYAERNGGVLVTRHDFHVYSVALSSVVPFGVTIEQDATRHLKRQSRRSSSTRLTASPWN